MVHNLAEYVAVRLMPRRLHEQGVPVDIGLLQVDCRVIDQGRQGPRLILESKVRLRSPVGCGYVGDRPSVRALRIYISILGSLVRMRAVVRGQKLLAASKSRSCRVSVVNSTFSLSSKLA